MSYGVLTDDHENITGEDKNLSCNRESLTGGHKRSTADLRI
jgi:hypothetical protein